LRHLNLAVEVKRMVASPSESVFLGGWPRTGRMTTVARLLRWILFSIVMVVLTSLVIFLVFVWVRIIFLAVF
jgi:hypothetical protein